MRVQQAVRKAVVMAGVLALSGVALLPKPAQALQFNASDAVLVLYGNGTEYYRNLGAVSSLVSGGANVTIDQSIMSQLGGAAPIEYTILGGNAANFGALPTSTFQGSAVPASNTGVTTGWSSSRNGQIDQGQYWNTIVNWAGQVGTISGTEHVLGASDSRSFTSFFGTSDTLNGAFPRRMSSNIESTLNLLERAFLPAGTQTAQSSLGQGLLTLIAGSGAGQFTFTGDVAPVPVPAAAILFGSGLIGLAGLARRSRA
jgi:hypothetical protein